MNSRGFSVEVNGYLYNSSGIFLKYRARLNHQHAVHDLVLSPVLITAFNAAVFYAMDSLIHFEAAVLRQHLIIAEYSIEQMRIR
ncbi:hypothetical protein MHIR_DE00344 [Candidatus Doolittlea endobia]|uniref:Uncharacterized protein n=1 Tax=Candidatus Doolittlea endobia TaxID=1778262 RepID=A0A143WSX5_9ENTR|nr:hypothetical protein MHIR_DE00344 [Candidatus Doolittlea endobia]